MFRQICIEEYGKFIKKMKGPIVMDESLFSKKYSGNKSMVKYSSCHYQKKKWVFGIYSPQEKILRMKFVMDRSEKSLLPLIVEWVEEGVEIWSNKWKAYHSIKDGIKFMEEVKDENGKYSGKMVEKTYHYTHKMVL